MGVRGSRGFNEGWGLEDRRGLEEGWGVIGKP